MKRKDIKILRDKDIKTLEKEVTDRKKKLMIFMPSLYAGREQNIKQGWKLRREIAQIMSILAEQESKRVKGESK